MPYLQDLGYIAPPFFLTQKLLILYGQFFRTDLITNKLADQPVLVNVSLYVHKTKTDYLFLSTL
jgi:hypothetical protein